MALTSYTTLKASIANWLNRSDLTDEIADDFIKLTEADFNSKLRIRKMITQVSITIDSETESLPADFLQVRDFYILQGGVKNLNHICQNVPVTTASDMAEQVLKFCDGRLSNQMWDTDYLVQDNRKQAIVSEIKPLQLDAFMV